MTRFNESQLKIIARDVSGGATVGQIAADCGKVYLTMRRHLADPALFRNIARLFPDVKAGLGASALDSLYRCLIGGERPDSWVRRKMLREALREAHPEQMTEIDADFSRRRWRGAFRWYVDE